MGLPGLRGGDASEGKTRHGVWGSGGWAAGLNDSGGARDHAAADASTAVDGKDRCTLGYGSPRIPSQKREEQGRCGSSSARNTRAGHGEPTGPTAPRGRRGSGVRLPLLGRPVPHATTTKRKLSHNRESIAGANSIFKVDQYYIVIILDLVYRRFYEILKRRRPCGTTWTAPGPPPTASVEPPWPRPSLPRVPAAPLPPRPYSTDKRPARYRAVHRGPWQQPGPAGIGTSSPGELNFRSVTRLPRATPCAPGPA